MEQDLSHCCVVVTVDRNIGKIGVDVQGRCYTLGKALGGMIPQQSIVSINVGVEGVLIQRDHVRIAVYVC